MRSDDLIPKPFSQACENNKAPILGVLARAFATSQRVIEIGSGTGQHAVYFAKHLPHLDWQTSDRCENHAGILAWIRDGGPDNARPPLELDVDATWPALDADAAFSANTAHIMHWPSVVNMFAGVAHALPAGGVFALYGPFAYHGRHTSESNARFDAMLRAQDPGMGIRDLDAVGELAHAHAMTLAEDHALPANNRLLLWQRE